MRKRIGEADMVTLDNLASSQDGVYQIFSLCFARSKARRAPDNFLMRDIHDGPMPLDYNFWILQNAHRIVLVDTGFGPRASGERGRPLDIDPLEALRRLGIDPDGIEDIVLTHLHYDHAGNIGRFAKARFHIQDAEVAFATGRCMCEPQLRWAFDVEDVTTLVRHTFAERVCFHDGDAAPLPGDLGSCAARPQCGHAGRAGGDATRPCRPGVGCQPLLFEFPAAFAFFADHRCGGDAAFVSEPDDSGGIGGPHYPWP
jgi:hypothetical protein